MSMCRIPIIGSQSQSGESVEIDDADLAVIIEALESAAMWLDARSRVIDAAARRSARRYPGRAVDPGSDRKADRRRASNYAELAARLKKERSE